MLSMEVLRDVGLGLLTAGFALLGAEVAKASRRARVSAIVGMFGAAFLFLVGYVVQRAPDQTIVRTYLAFPVPGKRLTVPSDFPNIFTGSTVPLPPDTLTVSKAAEGRCLTHSAVVPGRT